MIAKTRSDNFSKFANLGFPNKKLEDWKFSDFNEIISKEFKNINVDLKNQNRLYQCFETQEELGLKRKIQLKQGKPPIYDRSSLKLVAVLNISSIVITLDTSQLEISPLKLVAF